jgi:cytidine deaminase
MTASLPDQEQCQQLLAAARQARQRAHAPYSKFPVGAALLTSDGQVITGVNIESASYGLTICAERVAAFKALSEGHRTFSLLAVVADTATLTPPCGACRQVLWELAGDIPVVLGNLNSATARFPLQELLPLPFDGRFLDEKALK